MLPLYFVFYAPPHDSSAVLCFPVGVPVRLSVRQRLVSALWLEKCLIDFIQFFSYVYIRDECFGIVNVQIRHFLTIV